MKNLMLGGAFAMALSTMASADPIVTGSIEVEVAENSAGDYAAATTFNAGVVAAGLAFGEISIESVDGNTFEVNKWYIGSAIGTNSAVSFGNHDGGVFVEAYSDYSTIADPTINESLIVTLGDAAVALGFTDITNDITDVSNVQGAYFADAGVVLVSVSADYNFDTEEYVVGTRAGGVQLGVVALGSTLSYSSDVETVAYEIDAGLSYGLTVYANGDQDDAFRNVGAGYERGIGNMTIFADVNYDVNAEEVTPKAGVTLNF